MLTTLVDEAFDSDDWLFEIKWDGYRAVSGISGGKVELYSRNNLSFNSRYPEIVEELSTWPIDAVLDGEIVALDENGHSRFQFLQNWMSDQQGTLRYYMFDILWLEGYDLREVSLIDRKKILKQIMPQSDAICYSDHVEKNGVKFFEAASERGLEGIIAKKKNGTYETDTRSKNWLKIKTALRQEAVIVGFTEPAGSRSYFGALVLGIYENGKLEYAGHTGTGFTQKTLKEVWGKLEPLITDKSPFDVKPKTRLPATWVKPKLICEVKFQEWTQGHIMRVPVFMGLRADKKPIEVKKEDAMASKKIQEPNNKNQKNPKLKSSKRDL